MKEIHLSINCNEFLKRSMNNFLRIYQKLPIDFKNSEMKEICEIAKMFEAEDIYNKRLTYIVAYQDPNLKTPDRKYQNTEGKQYLTIENESNLIQHDSDIDDSYFEDADDQYYKGDYYKINNGNNDKENEENSDSSDEKENKLIKDNNENKNDENIPENEQLISNDQEENISQDNEI